MAETKTRDVADALNKLRSDLGWRGPSGRHANFIVLPRLQAEALLTYVTALENAMIAAANVFVEKRRGKRQETSTRS